MEADFKLASKFFDFVRLSNYESRDLSQMYLAIHSKRLKMYSY